MSYHRIVAAAPKRMVLKLQRKTTQFFLQFHTLKHNKRKRIFTISINSLDLWMQFNGHEVVSNNTILHDNKPKTKSWLKIKIFLKNENQF